MIYIDKNRYNTNILYLTSISTIENPYYLFQFINDFNKNTTYFHCEDSSNAKCAYNQFIICDTGNTSVILTAGTINLDPGGYTVNIYEASAVTLDISATTGTILSVNKAFVSGQQEGITNEIYL